MCFLRTFIADTDEYLSLFGLTYLMMKYKNSEKATYKFVAVKANYDYRNVLLGSYFIQYTQYGGKGFK